MDGGSLVPPDACGFSAFRLIHFCLQSSFTPLISMIESGRLGDLTRSSRPTAEVCLVRVGSHNIYVTDYPSSYK